MSLSTWFEGQLQSSLDGFIWAVEQVPTERRYVRPPYFLGEWPAARHAFHLLHYEQLIALPSMRQWRGDPVPAMFGVSEEATWHQNHASGGSPQLAELLDALHDVRAEQIALLALFDGQAWESRRDTIWGPKPLRWVVTKTYQHTAEHTHDVLSIALFWDTA